MTTVTTVLLQSSEDVLDVNAVIIDESWDMAARVGSLES